MLRIFLFNVAGFMATHKIENNVIYIVHIYNIIFVCVYECQTQQGSGQSRSPNQERMQEGGAFFGATDPFRFLKPKNLKVKENRRRKKRNLYISCAKNGGRGGG